ncbi:MAG: Crp/Fnr family transcriptional regulator [Pyrinomonadaceae bacterium]
MKSNSLFNEQIYLRDAELFQDLTAAEIDALGEQMPVKEVGAGTVFYSPEHPTEVLLFLKKGRVRLFYLSAGGKAFTTATLESGTFFGEMTLLGQSLYGKYAEAVTPCTLCVISRDDVKTLFLSDLRISYRIIESLSKRLAETERRLADFAFKQVPARLAALLLSLADKKPVNKQNESVSSDPAFVEIACTHEELSQMTGVHRETITRVLNNFRANGLIELHRGKIVLLDEKALTQLSIG